MAKSKNSVPYPRISAHFGKISIGDESASVGLNITIGDMKLEQLTKTLCKRRLSGSILLGDAHPDQTELIDKGRVVVSGAFDTGRVSTGPNDVKVRLSFARDEIDVNVLPDFANSEGWLSIDKVDEIPAKKPGGSGDDGDAQLKISA